MNERYLQKLRELRKSLKAPQRVSLLEILDELIEILEQGLKLPEEID